MRSLRESKLVCCIGKLDAENAGQKVYGIEETALVPLPNPASQVNHA